MGFRRIICMRKRIYIVNVYLRERNRNGKELRKYLGVDFFFLIWDYYKEVESVKELY